MNDLLEPIFAKMNPEQLKAVKALDGPLLILAGAGSGKTRVLTHRFAHLVASGRAAPHQILAVTFTNKAAREMESRIQAILNEMALRDVGPNERLWISTFHSIGSRILREHIDLLGYQKNFVIYDTSDQLAMVKRITQSLKLDEKLFPAKQFASRINALKTEGYTPDQVKGQWHLLDQTQFEVFLKYEQEMKRSNALDFGDLLIKMRELFTDYPDLLEVYRTRFRYIMVDEYQDTNAVQYQLIRLLSDGHRNLCVVGDEDQSIYSWRGADIQNILSFEKDFPETEVIKLEQNYRSTQTIINAATAVIQNNTQRKNKVLFTENPEGEKIIVREETDEYGEAKYVVSDIVREVSDKGRSGSEIAIFYRTNAQSRVLEEQLRMRGLSYRLIGGVKFYDRMEVKDILAYLRLIANPRDNVSYKRIINVPTRGIGKTTVDRLEDIASENGLSLWEATLKAIAERQFNAGATGKLRRFTDLLEKLCEFGSQRRLSELNLEVVDQTEYVKRLKAEDTPEAEARIENLEELQNAIVQFEAERGSDATLQSFLEEMALVSDLDSKESTDDQNAITLMTLHISKGLEFPVVYIVGCEEGLFPSGRATESQGSLELEEERRLCYVGMTRAEEKLTLTHAKTRKVWGSEQMNSPSRFLKEIPKEYALVTSSYGSQRPRFLGHSETGFGQSPQDSARSWNRPSIHTSRRSTMAGVERDFEDSFDAFADDFDQRPEQVSYRKGLRVRHPSYGTGQVLATEGSGEALKVTVVFADQTVKKFVAKYARLEKT